MGANAGPAPAPAYSESGSFSDTTSKSSAPGVTAGGSRFNTTIGSTASFRPAIPQGGLYDIYVTLDDASGGPNNDANSSYTVFFGRRQRGRHGVSRPHHAGPREPVAAARAGVKFPREPPEPWAASPSETSTATTAPESASAWTQSDSRSRRATTACGTTTPSRPGRSSRRIGYRMEQLRLRERAWLILLRRGCRRISRQHHRRRRPLARKRRHCQPGRVDAIQRGGRRQLCAGQVLCVCRRAVQPIRPKPNPQHAPSRAEPLRRQLDAGSLQPHQRRPRTGADGARAAPTRTPQSPRSTAWISIPWMCPTSHRTGTPRGSSARSSLSAPTPRITASSP